MARNNATTTYEYHSTFKLPTKVTPPTGASRATSYSYDSKARVDTITNGLGDETVFSYNSRGLVTSVTQPLDTTVTTFFYHDGTSTAEPASWNLAGIVGPVDDTTTFHYDATHGARLDFLVDPSRLRTVYRKDAIGRDTAVIHRTANTEATTRFEYDDANRVRARIDPEGVRHEWQENAAGLTQYRMVGTTSADTTKFTYTAAGNPQQVTNRAGQRTWSTYDARGRLTVRETEQPVPDSGNHTMTVDTATFSYDADGNLT